MYKYSRGDGRKTAEDAAFLHFRSSQDVLSIPVSPVGREGGEGRSYGRPNTPNYSGPLVQLSSKSVPLISRLCGENYPQWCLSLDNSGIRYIFKALCR
jgi:hypothetical protein